MGPLCLWQCFWFVPRKNGKQAQNHHFWPQKGPLWSFWAKNGLPNGQTDIHRRSEGFKSYLRIWGWYGHIKLIISETEKWGSCGCSVKKTDFEVKNGPKLAMAAAWKLPMQSCQHKKVVFLVSSHDATKSFGGCIQKNYFRSKNMIFGPKTWFWPKKGPFSAFLGQKPYAKRQNGHSSNFLWCQKLPQDVYTTYLFKVGCNRADWDMLYGCSVK